MSEALASLRKEHAIGDKRHNTLYFNALASERKKDMKIKEMAAMITA